MRRLDPQKRKKLLDAALTLFVEQGEAHTTTAQIARQAGTAAGTLFLYFPTRQALLDELALSIGLEQADYINALLQPSYTARQTFQVIWQGSLRWFLQNPRAYRFIQQVRDTGLISPQAVQRSNEFFVYYYTAIQKGEQEGSIRALPADLIGEFLYQDIAAVMNHLLRQPLGSAHEQIIQQGFDIFWRGIQSVETPGADKEMQ